MTGVGTRRERRSRTEPPARESSDIAHEKETRRRASSSVLVAPTVGAGRACARRHRALSSAAHARSRDHSRGRLGPTPAFRRGLAAATLGETGQTVRQNRRSPVASSRAAPSRRGASPFVRHFRLRAPRPWSGARGRLSQTGLVARAAVAAHGVGEARAEWRVASP